MSDVTSTLRQALLWVFFRGELPVTLTVVHWKPVS